MPIILSLISAASYGIADFLGGTASRRLHALVATLIAMVSGSVFILVVCLVVGGTVSGADVAWSMAGGATGSLALATFYSALANGPMGVVAPLSAVTSAIVPILIGLALGERPSPVVMLGIGLALPASRDVWPPARSYVPWGPASGSAATWSCSAAHPRPRRCGRC